MRGSLLSAWWAIQKKYQMLRRSPREAANAGSPVLLYWHRYICVLSRAKQLDGISVPQPRNYPRPSEYLSTSQYLYFFKPISTYDVGHDSIYQVTRSVFLEVGRELLKWASKKPICTISVASMSALPLQRRVLRWRECFLSEKMFSKTGLLNTKSAESR